MYPFWAARLLHVAPLAFHLAFFASARRALVDVLAAVALSLALPSFVGASRAFVSGQPLSWSVLDFGAVPAQSTRRCSNPLPPDRILPDPFSISHERAGMAVSQRCGVDLMNKHTRTGMLLRRSLTYVDSAARVTEHCGPRPLAPSPSRSASSLAPSPPRPLAPHPHSLSRSLALSPHRRASSISRRHWRAF